MLRGDGDVEKSVSRGIWKCYLGSCRNSGADDLAFRGGRLGMRQVYKRGGYPHAE